MPNSTPPPLNQNETMRTYQLYYSFTASANDPVHIDIRQSGEIVGIDWELYTSSAPTTGDTAVVELGFNSTLQSTHDAQNLISSISCVGCLTTSGVGTVSSRKWAGPMSVPVKQTDRLYLNVFEQGSSSWVVRAIVHVR